VGGKMKYFKLIIVGIVLFLIVFPSIATDEDAKMTKKARQLFFNVSCATASQN